jgi:hypothetical protein
MRRRYAWALGVLATLCVVAVAVLLRNDVIQTSAAKLQRDFELKAHRSLIQSLKENSPSLDAFSTDGCSGGLSKAWRTVSNRFPVFAKAHKNIPPWEPCCVAHDRSYHSAGGANKAHESYAARLSADKALRACVFGTRHKRSAHLSAEYGLSEAHVTAAYEAISNAMFDAVRVGGLPCSGLAWRWGYGYPRCPGTAEN